MTVSGIESQVETASIQDGSNDTAVHPTPASVFATVIEVLGKIVDDDYLESLDVSIDSRFEADLELESMEIVQLAEELIGRYGSDVDFVGWFGDMELDELIELTIGDLVDLIVASLNAPGAQAEG